jgi:hypothetical protein
MKSKSYLTFLLLLLSCGSPKNSSTTTSEEKQIDPPAAIFEEENKSLFQKMNLENLSKYQKIIEENPAEEKEENCFFGNPFSPEQTPRIEEEPCALKNPFL